MFGDVLLQGRGEGLMGRMQLQRPLRPTVAMQCDSGISMRESLELPADGVSPWPYFLASEGPVSYRNGTKESLPVGCRVKVTKLA